MPHIWNINKDNNKLRTYQCISRQDPAGPSTVAASLSHPALERKTTSKLESAERRIVPLLLVLSSAVHVVPNVRNGRSIEEGHLGGTPPMLLKMLLLRSALFRGALEP